VDFLRIDGGAATNNLLVQFQSDILQVEIHRPKVVETTALGAALLAGLAAGIWKDHDEIRRQWQIDATFMPRMNPDEVSGHLERWETALAKI
jgi:glycerol kinase